MSGTVLVVIYIGLYRLPCSKMCQYPHNIYYLRENSHILNTLTATESRSDYHSVVTADDRLLFKHNDNVENTVKCSFCHNLVVSVVVRRFRMTS